MLKTIKSPVIALLVAAVLWGIASPVIKYTLFFVPPFTFLLLRFLISSLILYFLVDWKKGYLKNMGKTGFIKLFLLSSLGGGINLGLYFVAMNKTSAIEGSIIYAMAPIFVFLGGVLFLKEKETLRGWLGFLTTTLGFLLIVIKPIFDHGLTLSNNLFGNLIMLGSCVAWALYALLSKIFFNNDAKGKTISPVLLTFFTSFAGVIVILPFGLFEIFNLNINYVAGMPGILYMAVFSSVIAFIFYNYGVKKVLVSHVTIFEYLVPAVSLPLAVVFLKEEFSIVYVFGFILLFLGLYVSEHAVKSVKHLKNVHKEFKHK